MDIFGFFKCYFFTFKIVPFLNYAPQNSPHYPAVSYTWLGLTKEMVKKPGTQNLASFGVLTIAQTFFFWGEKGTQFKKRYLYRYRHVKKCCWLLAYQHWHFVESTFPTSIQDWHDLSVSWSSYDMLKNSVSDPDPDPDWIRIPGSSGSGSDSESGA